MPGESSCPSVPQPIQPMPYRFRLVHLVYIVTLLAVSLGTFGPPGILAGVPLALFWTVVFSSRSRRRAFFFFGCVFLLMCPCLLPAINTAREAARRVLCSNNLKLISLALLNYHQKYSCFPPAFVPDEKGQPRHSWRVLILPFLGHQTLYDAYNFDEPWDGPNNRKLFDQRPVEYWCPADVHRLRQNDSCTSYVAVVGPATAWPGPVGKKWSDFADPTSETLLIVDTAGDHIPWTQPRDLTFPDALDQLTSTDPDQIGGHRSEGFFHMQFMGRNAAMVDGSTKFLYGSLSRNSWSHLLADRDGANPVADGLERGTTPPAELKIGNCIRLGVWIVVALFPLPWVWLNPTPARRNSTEPATQTV